MKKACIIIVLFFYQTTFALNHSLFVTVNFPGELYDLEYKISKSKLSLGVITGLIPYIECKAYNYDKKSPFDSLTLRINPMINLAYTLLDINWFKTEIEWSTGYFYNFGGEGLIYNDIVIWDIRTDAITQAFRICPYFRLKNFLFGIKIGPMFPYEFETLDVGTYLYRKLKDPHWGGSLLSFSFNLGYKF